MSDFSSKSVVGLTGGIATGKSTALQKFMELGWSVLSADSIVEKILATDVNIQKKLTDRWGEDVKEICGRIDKGAVGRIVFENNSERQWLESLLHPMVRSKWISFVHSRPDNKCMIELPLLFENNLQKYFTCTISMFAPHQTSLDRLFARGSDPDDAQCRISAQMPVLQKAGLADFVLFGGGENDFLDQQIKQLDPCLL